MTIYLDYSASTPIDPRVLLEMNHVFIEVYGNADSRTHIYGARAKELVERSRKTIADLLEVAPNEVIFTSGATESNNLAILGLQQYGLESGKKHLITTAIEHKSVLEPMRVLEKRGFAVDYVAPDASGRIDASKLLGLVRDDTLLVSVMHVNNETGIIQPVDEIGEELYQRGVLFHIDAAQSFGKLNASLRNTRYDMLTLTAHKIRGPQGIGALILRRRNYKRPPLEPLFYGGPQEFGYRPGTVAVPLLVGLAKAALLIEEVHDQLVNECRRIRESLLQAIAELPHVINGDPDYCVPGVINISFPGVDAESVFAALKEEYAFSNGSACNSGSYASSHVLTAMGLPAAVINSALRISWWRDTEPIDFGPLVGFIKSQI